MDEQQHSNAVRHLQVIYTDIAQRVRAITAARPSGRVTRVVMAAAAGWPSLQK